MDIPLYCTAFLYRSYNISISISPPLSNALQHSRSMETNFNVRCSWPSCRFLKSVIRGLKGTGVTGGVNITVLG